MVASASIIMGRVHISALKGIKTLSGYLQLNEGNGHIEVVVENRGHAEKHLSFVMDDKGNKLGVFAKEKLKPFAVKVIPIEKSCFKRLREEVQEIYLSNGMRKSKRKKEWKNDLDKLCNVGIIKRGEIIKVIEKHFKWVKKNEQVYFGQY